MSSALMLKPDLATSCLLERPATMSETLGEAMTLDNFADAF